MSFLEFYAWGVVLSALILGWNYNEKKNEALNKTGDEKLLNIIVILLVALSWVSVSFKVIKLIKGK